MTYSLILVGLWDIVDIEMVMTNNCFELTWIVHIIFIFMHFYFSITIYLYKSEPDLPFLLRLIYQDILPYVLYLFLWFFYFKIIIISQDLSDFIPLNLIIINYIFINQLITRFIDLFINFNLIQTYLFIPYCYEMYIIVILC